MKCLLVAVNAKYIHSNPGILCLKKYYDKYGDCDVQVDTSEYTINQQIDFIVSDIYRQRPEILCFSCYIWNIRYVVEIADTIHKILPDTIIWAGGPEVSYDAPAFLETHTVFNGIMCGEGEKVFTNLMKVFEGKLDYTEVSGICYRTDEIHYNPQSDILDLSDVPFIYDDMTEFENRIVYYESSRGCPFSCSYCLSSIDKKLRFRNIDMVLQELQFFINNKVKQVKFVDRTFNCAKKHAMDIWKYIYEHDNGITNFHFEVAADLITDEELELLSHMRPGLVQLEIGIQSTNQDTIEEIDRTMNLDRVTSVIAKIKAFGNINQHVDLIAGLPYENLESFKHSFDQVYVMKCEQLQLGFLKVLSGSKMYIKAKDYGIEYTSTPPYEVLKTRWLSYDDIMELKQVEDMVEVYYNSGQFENTMEYLEKFFESPYELYRTLGKFYSQRFTNAEKQSRIARYELMLEYVRGLDNRDISVDEFKEWMTYDVYIRENAKKRPSFAVNLNIYEKELRELYRIHKGTGDNVHIEVFEHIYGSEKTYVLFDYNEKRAVVL